MNVFLRSSFIFLIYTLPFVSLTYASPLDKIKLPHGFHIDFYAKNVFNARSLSLSDSGVVFVGTRKLDKVYAIVDRNKDNKADQIYILAEGLNSPNGVAYKNGDLYISEISRITKLVNIEEHLSAPPKPIVVYDQLPKEKWHGWKFIRFGPDEKLYVPVGAPCNVCEKKDDRFASIMRMDKTGQNQEIYAKGIRNSVGFDWHPKNNELWFTDNGRDRLGDELPPDELNHAPKKGMHFGFPYCHGKNIADPKFGKKEKCDEFTPAAQELGPHVASLGMRFYTGEMFPENYHNQIFIAEHGSWNRSKKIGYRITLVTLQNNKPVNYEVFAEGWLEGEKPWGRPVDVLVMPDGALLISDDYANAIYRIWYDPIEK